MLRLLVQRQLLLGEVLLDAHVALELLNKATRVIVHCSSSGSKKRAYLGNGMEEILVILDRLLRREPSRAQIAFQLLKRKV